ncbi:MAG: GMC family oxidoreductase N-terminal domain-containing protein [Candidatus Methanomethylicia archaeon]|jgi:ferredoxin|nr:GMC family oxidoreductase N-terminal domain-containing protein [Candidatus Methanomethylicia archaeon]MCQ5341007.1 GMC family oxidoreductase N-terminal domain-containing protein [Candidatus Methanomethylicia archaeon]
MFIIVGSGAGGATIAKELACVGKEVLIIERGSEIPTINASKSYNIVQSGIEIWHNICLGGTTLVSLGNAVRANIDELNDFYLEAERELNVKNVPYHHMGNATKMLLEVSSDWKVMPKHIDFSKCKSCGKCPFGCPYNAKWDSTHFIREALMRGAKLMLNSPVEKVIIKNNKAIGVKLLNGKEIFGDTIILSAGSIETPRILIRSGIDYVGDNLFVDAFITIGGIIKDKKPGLNKELNMAIFIKREDYLISPHYSTFLLPNLLSRGIKANPDDIIGLMVKIADEPIGIVSEDKVLKNLTKRDLEKLEKGKKEAEELLLRVGVDYDSIVSTHIRGAHPGGTCSKITNGYEPILESLYLSDASTIKGPFGLPPILTIISKAKKLSSILTSRA